MNDNTPSIPAMIVWCVIQGVALLYAAGCAPIKPGEITNRQSRSWSYATVPLGKDGDAVLIVPQRGQSNQQTHVIQPSNPAGTATLTTPTASATVPPSFQPARPASSAQSALGSMVWIGGAIMALGLIGLALRRFTPFGAIIPVGVSAMIAAAGGLMIAYITVLDREPWWVTWLCVAGVVTAGVIIAVRDNWKKVRAATDAAAKALAQAAPITLNVNGGAS